MSYQRSIAYLLLATAALVILGMVFNSNALWFAIDIIEILACSGSGLYLLRQKKQV